MKFVTYGKLLANHLYQLRDNSPGYFLILTKVIKSNEFDAIILEDRQYRKLDQTETINSSMISNIRHDDDEFNGSGYAVYDIGHIDNHPEYLL